MEAINSWLPSSWHCAYFRNPSRLPPLPPASRAYPHTHAHQSSTFHISYKGPQPTNPSIKEADEKREREREIEREKGWGSGNISTETSREMEPNDNAGNTPGEPHSPNNGTNRPAPPPGVVAGALAICAAFFIFGVGCYLAFRWLCRTRAGTPTARDKPLAAEPPRSPTTWRHRHLHGRARNGDGVGGRAGREDSVV